MWLRLRLKQAPPYVCPPSIEFALTSWAQSVRRASGMVSQVISAVILKYTCADESCSGTDVGLRTNTKEKSENGTEDNEWINIRHRLAYLFDVEPHILWPSIFDQILI